VYCADIGSVRKGRFGWAGGSVGGGVPLRWGTDIGELATEMATRLNARVPTALDFECPLFVPITDDPCGLTALLRTGWSTDLSLLATPALVLKA
jgi:hypothetical protein